MDFQFQQGRRRAGHDDGSFLDGWGDNEFLFSNILSGEPFSFYLSTGGCLFNILNRSIKTPFLNFTGLKNLNV